MNVLHIDQLGVLFLNIHILDLILDDEDEKQLIDATQVGYLFEMFQCAHTLLNLEEKFSL